MKRFIPFVICCLILLGISGRDALGLGSGKSKVFKPDQLLSEADAARLVGIPTISLDRDSLEVDPETGTSDTFYVYDISGGTLLALFHLVQNGAMTKANMVNGSAAKEYDFCYAQLKDESDILSGLGDKAFFYKSYSRAYVLYGNYFFMTAFKSPTDDESKNRSINIAIAKHIIENIKKK